MGPSGSGKPTIARSAHDLGRDVLADDGLIIRKMPDGDVRAFRTPWRMFASPWNGSFGERPESVAVRSVFFLNHDVIDRLYRVRPIAAAVRLLQNALPPLLRQMGNRDSFRVFELLTRLTSYVPCYELQFTPACSFWELIDSP